MASQTSHVHVLNPSRHLLLYGLRLHCCRHCRLSVSHLVMVHQGAADHMPACKLQPGESTRGLHATPACFVLGRSPIASSCLAMLYGTSYLSTVPTQSGQLSAGNRALGTAVNPQPPPCRVLHQHPSTPWGTGTPGLAVFTCHVRLSSDRASWPP